MLTPLLALDIADSPHLMVAHASLAASKPFGMGRSFAAMAAFFVVLFLLTVLGGHLRAASQRRRRNRRRDRRP